MRAMASRGAQAQGAAQPSAVCRSSFGGRGVSYSAARIAPRSSTSRQQVVVQAVSAGQGWGSQAALHGNSFGLTSAFSTRVMAAEKALHASQEDVERGWASPRSRHSLVYGAHHVPGEH